MPYYVDRKEANLKFVQYLFLSKNFLELSYYVMAGKRQPRINPLGLLSLWIPCPELRAQESAAKSIEDALWGTTDLKRHTSEMRINFDDNLI